MGEEPDHDEPPVPDGLERCPVGRGKAGNDLHGDVCGYGDDRLAGVNPDGAVRVLEVDDDALVVPLHFVDGGAEPDPVAEVGGEDVGEGLVTALREGQVVDLLGVGKQDAHGEDELGRGGLLRLAAHPLPGPGADHVAGELGPHAAQDEVGAPAVQLGPDAPGPAVVGTHLEEGDVGEDAGADGGEAEAVAPGHLRPEHQRERVRGVDLLAAEGERDGLALEGPELDPVAVERVDQGTGALGELACPR